FFFRAEDGIRDFHVTGVQTCALPIFGMLMDIHEYDLPDDYIKHREVLVSNLSVENLQELAQKYIAPDKMIYLVVGDAETQLEKRSEERRVGKESRSQRSTDN